MSGSIPLRVGSTFRLGSAAFWPTRGTPVCWKQNPPIAGTCPVPSTWPAGVTPSQFAAPGPIGLSTKIWNLPLTGAVVRSCQLTQGPGFVGSTAEPPATDGFSASRLGWMLSDGTGTVPPPVPRLWPAKIHLPWFASPVLSKRLANTLLWLKPLPVVFSYHVAHGTVRPAPAKSIWGASPSWPWSKLSEPGNGRVVSDRPPTVPLPRVVHAAPANERVKIWSCPLVSCRKIDHGTAGLPAVRAPPTTSAFLGSSPLTLLFLSIPAAGSSLTRVPGGSA